MVGLRMLIYLGAFLSVCRSIIGDVFDNKLFIWVLITFNITNKNCYHNIINRG
jgi:hypothetical protein